MPTVFAIDTNCMVAAVCGWHAHHRAAVAEIDRRLDRGHKMLVPAHSLTEAYSVITRFPAPHRLGPGEAWELLDVSFAGAGTVVTLTVPQHLALLARTAKDGLSGGRVYDALIAECAEKAGADTLLTFNARHFDPLPGDLTIAVPA